MRLTSLSLSQFRSYAKRRFEFSPSVTVVVGENGAGKTNILEAVMMLATGKSFRAGLDREVIRWDAPVSRVGGVAGEESLELVLTHGSVNGAHAPLKKYLVNGLPRRMVDFVGVMPAVLFWPEDLEIVTDSPSVRRRYLDSMLIQADPEYRRNLLSYEKGLRQRNRLLDAINEGTAARSQLLFWDQLLIRSGGFLTDARAAFIAFANTTSLEHHAFEITYDKSVISESRLEQYSREEVAAKTTLVGPHRDDFVILGKERHEGGADGLRNLAKYGSRGEQRLAVLWLKLAELSYIERTLGERPILLLDDIFSELDERHRDLVAALSLLQQTIITSADRDSVPSSLVEHAVVVTV